MHESLMSAAEVDTLHEQVLAFHKEYGKAQISLGFAEGHFRDLGHELTRPIAVTLQAHGVVVGCNTMPRHKKRYETVSHPWRVQGTWLVPTDAAQGSVTS